MEEVVSQVLWFSLTLFYLHSPGASPETSEIKRHGPCPHGQLHGRRDAVMPAHSLSKAVA